MRCSNQFLKLMQSNWIKFLDCVFVYAKKKYIFCVSYLSHIGD